MGFNMDDFQFYVQTGLFHVLDLKAYDHILFLLVLTIIYQYKDWKKVLWLVTFFTLGHTFTLLLSVYQILTFNMAIVEFLIPLTIFLTALLNILFQKKPKITMTANIWLAFIFGLIHGVGFSSYFHLMVGKSAAKLIPLLEFALGIEAAQIVIVIITLFLGLVFQNVFKVSKRDWILIVSSLVAGITIPMMIERVFW
ncbi:MAG: HupE/UreJ family protein [Flavobacteriaceae bacterium]|nr:HupE/UreJ family protein [Flavobacteriaceae bacterium]